MQQYELEAWLGNDHGLTGEQLADLLTRASDIQARYPDPDDQAVRDAALSTAYRLILGQDEVLGELAKQRAGARAAELQALAGLRQAALMLVTSGTRSEKGFAEQAGVDRMAVRKWLGKK